jgi:hypothetical protein
LSADDGLQLLIEETAHRGNEHIVETKAKRITAGGLKDTATLLECYQQPANETLLAVMSEERKVREVAVSAGNG